MCNSCLVRNLNSYIYLLCSTFSPSYFNTCSSNLETGEPSQHSLVDTGKPRKTCVEVAGRRTFQMLTSSQQTDMSVCLSVCTSIRPQRATRLPMDKFSRNLTFQYFSKICRQILSFVRIWPEQPALYMKTNVQFHHISLSSSYNENCFTQKLYRQSKHIFCVPLLLLENFAALEMMWKNTVEPDRPQTTIWRMRTACLIPKATNTISEYVVLIACTNAL